MSVYINTMYPVLFLAKLLLLVAATQGHVLHNKYILLDVLVCSIAVNFYEYMQYFGDPKGRVKIQMMSKNLQ